MDRRKFIKTSSALGGATLVGSSIAFADTTNNFEPTETPWFDRSMRWAQLAFVENDPGHYDPDFWLDYFKCSCEGKMLPPLFAK